MRILKEIPHEHCKITLFTWNQKYIVKIEQGLLEQIYKVSEVEVMSPEEVEAAILREDFMKKVLDRFEEMHQDWYQALDI
ncbi:MAG: hypothetical protein KatS3mg033_2066 [Thermonema sp.]|jgi:hypothetical protein|uniref:hypothetical protein n=1 Tax=Thermonema TaxID=28194 RepID=UPI00056E1B6F|nr:MULTISPECIES: hypothetical protein [Thermonema]GIV40266.1 MAG: hypothetical protein KatS3mg033_2066 [Thermonema sp.]